MPHGARLLQFIAGAFADERSPVSLVRIRFWCLDTDVKTIVHSFKLLPIAKRANG